MSKYLAILLSLAALGPQTRGGVRAEVPRAGVSTALVLFNAAGAAWAIGTHTLPDELDNVCPASCEWNAIAYRDEDDNPPSNPPSCGDRITFVVDEGRSAAEACAQVAGEFPYICGGCDPDTDTPTAAPTTRKPTDAPTKAPTKAPTLPRPTPHPTAAAYIGPTGNAPVYIYDSTGLGPGVTVTGEIRYPYSFCDVASEWYTTSNGPPKLDPVGPYAWRTYRYSDGSCYADRVTAVVNTAEGPVTATSFDTPHQSCCVKSTAHDGMLFAVIRHGETFSVTCITNFAGHGDYPPVARRLSVDTGGAPDEAGAVNATDNATHYPYAAVLASTAYEVSGEVHYESPSCKNDLFTAQPGTYWHATSRGICLILKITATVHTPTGSVEAVSYTSAGTSFSQFAVIMTGSSAYAVTRIWDGRGSANHCYDPVVV